MSGQTAVFRFGSGPWSVRLAGRLGCSGEETSVRPTEITFRSRGASDGRLTGSVCDKTALEIAGVPRLLLDAACIDEESDQIEPRSTFEMTLGLGDPEC